MKALFIIITFFVSTQLYASEVCQKMASHDDKAFIKARIKSHKCEHVWTVGKANHAMEIVYLGQYCQKHEGGQAVDCLMARTCDVRGEKFADYGPSLILNAESKKSICEEDKYYLFGIDGYKGPTAWIQCKDKKMDKIIIQDPKGGRSECAIPAF